MKLAEQYLSMSEGTWDIPSTEKQATKLAKVMAKPLTAKKAEKALSGLVGDDDLFDFFLGADKEEAKDVRGMIADTLSKWLKASKKDPSSFKVPFSKESIAILTKIVKDAPKWTN